MLQEPFNMRLFVYMYVCLQFQRFLSNYFTKLNETQTATFLQKEFCRIIAGCMNVPRILEIKSQNDMATVSIAHLLLFYLCVFVLKIYICSLIILTTPLRPLVSLPIQYLQSIYESPNRYIQEEKQYIRIHFRGKKNIHEHFTYQHKKKNKKTISYHQQQPLYNNG